MNRYKALPALALLSSIACAAAAPAYPPAPAPASAPAAATEIVGYYPGWKSASFPVTAANVGAGRVSVLLYAFLDVCWNGRHGNPDASVNDVAPCQDAAGGAAATSANGALVLRDQAQDSANLLALAALKRDHPGLRVMVSVGGWNWSNKFSDVADSAGARAGFVASSVALMRRFDLDGVDIDWEYPGTAGVPCTPGQTCARPADKRNFVTLARELRSAFDAAGKADGKHYGITIAAGGNAQYVNGDVNGGNGGNGNGNGDGGPWIAQLAASLDWINIMAYDYHMPWEPRSGHHAALTVDPLDPARADGFYADASVRRYLAAGVAPRQLVLGLPFYGYGWKGCPAGAAGDGQYQPCAGAAAGGNDGGASYSYDHLLARGLLDAGGQAGGNGYRRYWNSAAQVPYLYNAQDKTWISYEDAASLRLKRDYIHAQQLRGAMFWELSADGGHHLLEALAPR